MEDEVRLAAMPMPLRWQAPPAHWTQDERGLTIAAGAITDVFIDPQGAGTTLNAPRLLGAVSGDFLFSARVRVAFAATFDAGVLLLWSGERLWAKLCFEYSPQGSPMVVSVVTRGASDDANSLTTPDTTIWLRVARMGHAFAFHASTDGETWQLIRHFHLEVADTIELGFLAQSPTGAGCTATFDDVRFARERLRELRDGT